MDENVTNHIHVYLTSEEATLIVAALRQFEPYWPADTDEVSRAELLAEIRRAVEHLTLATRPR
ncbi:MAG: hypothetical protein ACJ72O_00240 [Marmoricola sp.]